MASIQCTASMTNHAFGSEFTKRLELFERDVKNAAARAAMTANQTTQSKARSIRPPVPQRPGRKTTQGNMGRYLTWKVTGGYEVSFDVRAANQKVPYWFIQEIGTGQSATMKYGGSTGASRGRPAKGETTRRSVPSQIGRAIPLSLAFGTGVRGQYTAFGAGARQGLYLRRQLKGAPVFQGKGSAGRTVRISKEIHGKHMVKAGSVEGFRQYRALLLAAAKASLVQKYKP